MDFLKAAKEGNLKALKEGLRGVDSVNLKNNSGSTALHLAACYNRVEVVRFLINEKADIHARDVYGAMPVHEAARNGHEESLKILIRYQANFNAVDMDGNTPLHLAADDHHLRTVKYLVKKCEIDPKNKQGKTPLGMAVFTDESWPSADTVKFLLEKNADAGITNPDGDSILHRAVQEGSLSLVKYLLNHGMDLSGKNKKEQTPLFYTGLRQDMVKLLIRAGADINHRDHQGINPFHVIIQNAGAEDIKLLKFLLKNGVEINQQTHRGKTVLHRAADKGVSAIVKLLVKKKADINCEDEMGITPLDHAKKRNHPAVISFLERKGAVSGGLYS